MLDLLKSYKTYLSGLWKYRVSGMVAMLITGVLGIIITVVLPGNYEATARAYVDTKSILQPLMQGMTVQPDMQGQIQMMARTLVSRPNLEAIVQATGMDHDVQTQKGREALMQTLEKNIQFKPAGGTNFYSIEYRNQSRETALKVVTMLLDLFVKSTRTGKTADTQQAVQFIDQEIAKARDLLLQTETALKEFKIKHIEVMPNLAQDYVARSADIQRELQTARLEYRQAVNSRTAIRTRLEAVPEYVPVGGGQADGGGSETERRLESARKRLDDLLTRYTDAHPDVINTRHSIRELEVQLQKEALRPVDSRPGRGKIPNRLYQEMSIAMAEADAKVASLAARVAEAEAQAKRAREIALAIPKVEAEYIQLNRDYDSNKQNYEKLLQRRDAARLAGSIEENTGAREFRVVDPPRVSPRPVSPNRPLLLGIFFVVSLVLGLAVALVRELANPAFYEPNALKAATKVPLFGAITRYRDEAAQKLARKQSFRFTATLAGYTLVFVVLILIYVIDAGQSSEAAPAPTAQHTQQKVMS
ncbi:XrtA system polysaccharide chain length determinant [Lautropia mirabilis]|uniref:XrtA system polysaccharide chain length determinant n=1 Tax=Lautropia mirabilis TaxID=47671 RepID=UPI0028E7EBAC|nr:XrtA system polysaccharide chain length determinant [Lautropia mirabilis]